VRPVSEYIPSPHFPLGVWVSGWCVAGFMYESVANMAFGVAIGGLIGFCVVEVSRWRYL